MLPMVALSVAQSAPYQFGSRLLFILIFYRCGLTKAYFFPSCSVFMFSGAIAPSQQLRVFHWFRAFCSLCSQNVTRAKKKQAENFAFFCLPASRLLGCSSLCAENRAHKH